MLQDTDVSMKDLRHIKIVGAGAAGVVRLVEHKATKTRCYSMHFECFQVSGKRQTISKNIRPTRSHPQFSVQMMHMAKGMFARIGFNLGSMFPVGAQALCLKKRGRRWGRWQKVSEHAGANSWAGRSMDKVLLASNYLRVYFSEIGLK